MSEFSCGDEYESMLIDTIAYDVADVLHTIIDEVVDEENVELKHLHSHLLEKNNELVDRLSEANTTIVHLQQDNEMLTLERSRLQNAVEEIRSAMTNDRAEYKRQLATLEHDWIKEKSISETTISKLKRELESRKPTDNQQFHQLLQQKNEEIDRLREQLRDKPSVTNDPDFPADAKLILEYDGFEIGTYYYSPSTKSFFNKRKIKRNLAANGTMTFYVKSSWKSVKYTKWVDNYEQWLLEGKVIVE